MIKPYCYLAHLEKKKNTTLNTKIKFPITIKKDFHLPLERHDNQRIVDVLRSCQHEESYTSGSNKKIELSPYEFCSLYETTMASHCKLRAIIIPNINYTRYKKAELKKIPFNHVKETIYSELRSPDDPLWPLSWIYPLRKNKIDFSYDSLNFISRIPIYILSFNADWHDLTSTIITNQLKWIN